MVKKLLGALALFIGVMLGLAIINNLLNLHLNTKDDPNYRLGYIFGNLIGALLMGWFAYWLIKRGTKLLNTR